MTQPIRYRCQSTGTAVLGIASRETASPLDSLPSRRRSTRCCSGVLREQPQPGHSGKTAPNLPMYQ
jgi:hypothetical protein